MRQQVYTIALAGLMQVMLLLQGYKIFLYLVRPDLICVIKANDVKKITVSLFQVA